MSSSASSEQPEKESEQSETASKKVSPNNDSETAGINGDDKNMEVDETATIEVKKEHKTDASDIKTENETDLSRPMRKKRKYDEIDKGDISDGSSPTEFLGFPKCTEEEKQKANAEKKKWTNSRDQIDFSLFDVSLGKGKRSRIPNKRYEGLTTISKSFLTKSKYEDTLDTDSGAEVTSSEDGRNDEEHDHKIDHDPLLFHSTPSVSSKSKSKHSNISPATTAASRKSKISSDMSNPNYLKPFEHGWKRELVYRATFDGNNKRNGDVYYYTPSGKKIRSMREVLETIHESKMLTPDDFTFFKEPVGINDPEREIIREAKYKISTLRKVKSREKAALLSATKVNSNASTSVKVNNSPKLGGFKVKIPTSSRLSQGSNRNERKRTSNANASGDMEIGMLPPSWSPKNKSTPGKKSSWQAKTGGSLSSPLDTKPCRPCSIRCQGVSGLIPTLQCRLCLCLYHKECIGQNSHDVIAGYVCKNCQLEHPDSQYIPAGPAIGPPPLTPISLLKSNNTQSTTPPKLQRIPRPGEAPPFIPSPSIPQMNSLPKIPEPLKSHLSKLTAARTDVIHATSQTEPSKSIVGSVTTWFPPNSTIKMPNSSPNKPGSEGPKPQSLVFMGERKFLVVPKGNVLSISPTIGATVNTPPTNNCITSPTADKAPIFDGKDPRTESASVKNQQPVVPANESPPVIMPNFSVSSGTILGGADPITRIDSARTPMDFLKKQNQRETSSPPKTRRSVSNKKAASTPVVPVVKSDAEPRFMQNYLQNLSYGYQTLLYVFQYLKVQDLLRAGCVCTLWRDIAGHPSLWKTVRMKNSQVSNWEGLADALKKHQTENLDLRKMLLPSSGDDMWPLFSKAITRVDSLVRIELCRCPASVIEEIAKSNRNLQVINAVTIRCEKLDITSMNNLENLQELRLKSTNGFVLTSDLSPLESLIKLKNLSVTSVKELYKQNVEVIGKLINLESLDLGECSDFPDNFGTDVLMKLTKLEKLRLEKGQGTCCTFNILDAVSKISTLEQLELVNFDVKAGFDAALGACLNIKKLLIIPTYISQSATTNHMVLGGVIKLKSTLSHFVWGVTLELLRVTELFVDQCDDSPPGGKEKKKPIGNGDSIPVLKPVPIMKQENMKDESGSKEPPQVEILPLPTLQKLLLNCLPTTRVKILKIPFHATWRQSIVDTVN